MAPIASRLSGIMFLVVMALAMLSEKSNAQILLEVLNAVPEDCSDKVVTFAESCSDEFVTAGGELDFEWPPTEDPLAVDLKKASKYFKGEVEISEGCCASMCELANSRCMCDESTFNAIGNILFEDGGEFFKKMLKFAGKQCGFKPTALDLKGTCKKEPKNDCAQ